MAKAKSPVASYQAHTAKTKFGMGDFYGVGVKNPMGKPKNEAMGIKTLSKTSLAKGPKKLA